MLLSTPDEIENYRTSGLWGDARIDQLFVGHAQDRGDEIALIDDQDHHAVTGRKPQCLSFQRTWRRVVGLCNFLSGVGMKPDTVVAVLLPPCADAAVLSLAASRMGYILAPLPLTVGELEMREKIEQLGAKAIVCCAHYENEPVAERARNVAAELFSIRFVFSIGDGAPEGLIELQGVLDDEDSVDDEQLWDVPALPSADVVLSVNWSAASAQPSQALGRNHNQLLSAARHVHEQTDLEAGDCLMLVHHMTGLVGLAVGLVGAFDVGARVQFHHFRTAAKLSQTMCEFGTQHVCMPGVQWPVLHGILPMEVREQLKSVMLVWNRSHRSKRVFGQNETAARLLDITNFGELALFCQLRRHPDEIGSIPLGEIPSRAASEAAWMETHLFGMDESRLETDGQIVAGELCLKSAMLPSSSYPIAGAIDGVPLNATEEGFIHTDIGCHLVTEEHGEQRALFRPLGELSDILTMGALSERASDLDALYKECVGVHDAGAFLVAGATDGPSRLMAALVVDDRDVARENFYAFLKERKVSPTRWPRDIIFVEAIPRNTKGVVQRDSLIEAAELEKVA
ncbi:Acyl-CoA synthetase (AMP-forming)/AMP-acid ligase II [Cohaesibacter sp. ES.047]|uniref:AMP-binding protein n=1 Tax=Cohaesibacter sp. ES.047 TaxID=1798205 RepID=UPI000BB6ABE7|nr:AMP-binding protein [Cohaesibacter sp. ES.047]SNY93327.1 Acyl-CoA synthetase (AMP-forming)/AMP-acid ligase II [Cohaesibacter sp. ES.047]